MNDLENGRWSVRSGGVILADDATTNPQRRVTTLTSMRSSALCIITNTSSANSNDRHVLQFFKELHLVENSPFLFNIFLFCFLWLDLSHFRIFLFALLFFVPFHSIRSHYSSPICYFLIILPSPLSQHPQLSFLSFFPLVSYSFSLSITSC